MNTSNGSYTSGNNTSSTSYPGTGPQWSYVQTTEIIIAIVGILSNFVVIVVMLGRQSLRSQLTYKLTVSLAVADFISSVFLIPRTLRGFFPIPSGILGEIYCRTFKATFLWVSLVASTYSLLAITVERYFAIVHPLSYNTQRRKPSASLIIIVVWLSAFIMQSFCVYNNSYDAEQQTCRYKWPFGEWYQTFAGIGLFFATYFIPLLLLLLAYGRIFMVLRRSSQNCDATSSNLTIKARKKVVKMFLIVCLGFGICWAPNQFLFLIANFGYQINYNNKFYDFTRIFAACNVCLNPFIYAVWCRPFRTGFIAIFCRRKQTSNRTTVSVVDPVTKTRRQWSHRNEPRDVDNIDFDKFRDHLEIQTKILEKVIALEIELTELKTTLKSLKTENENVVIFV
ncbi:allatostatin-A receptor-like [Glandiceps talaboti]